MSRLRVALLGAVALTACTSVATSDQKESLTLLEKQRLCADVGRYMQTLQMSENMQRQRQAVDPEFAYNPQLGMCLFFGGYFDRSTETTVYVLKDSLTNRTLASFRRNEKQSAGQTEEERQFLLEKAQLMGQTEPGPLPKVD